MTVDKFETIELEEEVVRGIAEQYDLDNEELVKFLYDLGEMAESELLVELAKTLDI